MASMNSSGSAKSKQTADQKINKKQWSGVVNICILQKHFKLGAGSCAIDWSQLETESQLKIFLTKIQKYFYNSLYL